MMAHRPLSAWIASVELSADGTAHWAPTTDVNFGDERVDARALPEFGDGWLRRALPLDAGYLALGLVRDRSSGAVTESGTVIEVDNRAQPVRVSEPAARIISRLEDAWPDGVLPDADLEVLARENRAARYVLTDRLAAEGDPPPEFFHILPWELVDELAEQVSGMLDGTAPGEVVIQLRHWFTPVGSRFTASLEQLDEGLRGQDPVLARVAATALSERLVAVEPTRLPESTRMALARLTDRLARSHPFLAFTARRVTARLTAGTDTTQAGAIRLSTRLPAAADTAAGVRTQSLDATREPFTVRLIVTATGRAEVAISAPLPDDLKPEVTGSYGVMLLPVRVTGASGSTRYLIPLRFSDGHLSGRLDLPVPAGRFVEADVDGPPIGAAEAAFLSVTDVRQSVRGLRTRTGRAMWTQLATLLPPAHPLRAVIDGEIG